MWYEYLSENNFIKLLYNEVPALKNLRISREGDRITVSSDMPVFPDNPPKKWVEKSDSIAFVELDFFDIQEVILRSNNNTYRANIDIEKDEAGDLIVSISGTVQAKIRAAVGIIQSVRGY
ncbi:Imm50 family immunity protein [Paenibacillus methanolicus]|uniref:Imm50 family immunity protein n=1 Tax=Paenibacillus methanolicus TaxID=582686 RepID=UPI0011E81F05|nr:Imm50 family immunity protein [Paenibacillus methanolicus]